MSEQTIGFVGIGRMGSWMARHLLSAGYTVTVYDSNPAALPQMEQYGAQIVSSLAELGKASSLIILMLPNSTIVEQVVLHDGLADAMAPGSTLLDMSSSYAPATKKLAATLAARKLTLVDAPVSGGVKGAKQATLTIMFGGSADKFAELQPILATMGKMIQHVGETGAGHALKAINNYLSAASLYATSEAVMMAQKFGLDPKVALETINQSSGQSYSTHYKFPTFVLPRSFNSNFSLDLLLKDVKMVNQLAKELEVPTLLASVVEQVYQTAKNLGPAEQDHTEIFTFIEQITARGD